MEETMIDLSAYKNRLGRKHQAVRMLWNILWPLTTWFLPRSLGMGWKRSLLRMFGAKVHPTAQVYSSARIYYPANLTMEAYSCLADGVECYNVAPVTVGAHSTISQGTLLCTASHDITDSHHRLVTAPIMIEDQVWIGARAYIGMGVVVRQGAVVGATASVYKTVEPWTVVGGNPARFIKKREIR
ncbi:MAG: putative colanic acid biosynthesis acetyltransferase [Bacteroidales bacterium]|nr:putative colanic acid biosynthesis acetyltransferase [Bacteroidales bacterium]